MKRPRLTRKGLDGAAGETPAAPGSSLGLDDWEGRWPVDDTPAEDGVDRVPMMLNPQSPPTIAPS
jgi:hypothetical protein